jgi:hypothetical protein
MTNMRCVNLACVCNVQNEGDACSDYCAHPPAEPREDFCRCGHDRCRTAMQQDEHAPADDR